MNTELHVDPLFGNSFFQEMSVPIWGHEKCERSADALEATDDEFNRTIPETSYPHRSRTRWRIASAGVPACAPLDQMSMRSAVIRCSRHRSTVPEISA